MHSSEQGITVSKEDREAQQYVIPSLSLDNREMVPFGEVPQPPPLDIESGNEVVAQSDKDNSQRVLFDLTTFPVAVGQE